MKRTKSAAWFAAALCFAVAGCGDDPTSPGSQNANIRVLHASPGATNLDVFVDGGRIVQNIGYAQVSSYNTFAAGAHRIQGRQVNTTISLFEFTHNLDSGTKYTVIASGPVATIEPYVLIDGNSPPVAANSKLRVVHAAPGAGSVDVYITAPGADLSLETPDLANVQFRATSAYFDLLAGTYRVRVTPVATKNAILDSGTLTLATGQVRTLVAIDSPGGGAPFAAEVLSDLN